MKPLTKSQQKIYDFLKDRSQYGIPPSVREICAATGLKSTSTVHAHLKALENLGYISRDAGLNRAIHIEGCEQAAQVPILGKVTAGLPILAVEEVQGLSLIHILQYCHPVVDSCTPISFPSNIPYISTIYSLYF